MQQIQNHMLVDLSADYVNLRNYHVTSGLSGGSFGGQIGELAFIAKPGDSLTLSNPGHTMISDGFNSLLLFQGNVGPSNTWGGGDTMTVNNSGTLMAENGGAMAINANVTQTPDGMILVRTGSDLLLSGIVAGGTLKLNDATLADTPAAPVPQAGGGFTKGAVHYDDIQSNVVFAGNSDKITFQAAYGSQLSETWDAATHDLTVFEKTTPSAHLAPSGEIQMASLHLVGNYKASEFSIGGDQLIYTKG